MICRALLVGLAATLVAGCATKPLPRLAKYDPTEYSSFSGQGTGVIEGQAFLVTLGGDVKYGAGREVWLNPVTTYSTEWYERGVLKYESLEAAPAEVPPPRIAVADGEGRFRFDRLPAGEYYLACHIDWAISQYSMTGGIAHAKVKVEDGKVTQAVVTRR